MSRIESWATVFYPALNRRRRRYIEVKNDLVVFHKPAPGGSASGARDAYFPLSNIVALRPLVDYGAAAAERYTLRLECRAGATVEHVGAGESCVCVVLAWAVWWGLCVYAWQGGANFFWPIFHAILLVTLRVEQGRERRP